MSRPASARYLFIFRTLVAIAAGVASLVLLLAQTGANAQLEHQVTSQRYPITSKKIQESGDPYAARAIQELQNKIFPLEAEAAKNHIIDNVIRLPYLLAIPFVLSILGPLLQLAERHFEDRANKLGHALQRTAADSDFST